MVDFSPTPRLGREEESTFEPERTKSSFLRAAAAFKQAAREAMLRDGVHQMFLEDDHLSQMWSKHFERSERMGPYLPFDEPLPESFQGRNLRVLQWNLLAEGLVPEGFLMPLVSKTHVARVDEHLASLLQSGKPEDYENVVRWSAQGHRGMVWDGEACSWEDFARMAANMVRAMKGLPSAQKEARGLELKRIYNADSPDGGPGGGGQLAVNEHAIVGAEHRLLRVLWFVALMQPDIICFQELDNFAFVSSELSKLGYACGRSDAEPYVPLKDREGGSYAEKLKSSPWAFAPKWGTKRGKSTARHFLEKRIADGVGQKATFMGTDDWPTDDDGQAIFWRTDRFQIIGSPEFELLPAKDDVDAFIDGRTESVECNRSDQAATRVLLEFNVDDERVDGQQFFVSTTHLSSGTDAELYRIQELLHLGRAWGRTGLPEIWALDANTEINFEDLDGSKGSAMRIPMEANALQNFMQDQGLRSVWEACYDDSTRALSAPPASVWKMRGSASAQPKKVGEDMYELIDHVFFRGRALFDKGQQALRLRERIDPENPADRDWLALMPNELLPSDHLPIAWDFKLNTCSPRREVPVLLSTAQRLWLRLSEPRSETKTVEEIDRLLWLPPTASTDAATFDQRERPEPRTPPAKGDTAKWLERLAEDASVVLDGVAASQPAALEVLRSEVIAAKGRHSREAVECCLLGGVLFAAAASAATGEPLALPQGSQRPEVVVLAPAACAKLALAALRYVLRAFVATNDSRGTNGKKGKGVLWGLAAQVTETMSRSQCGYAECRRIIAAFDSQGQVCGQELDGLLLEIAEKLATPAIPNAPALLALRCIEWTTHATGTQVAEAARTVLRAIEAGNLDVGGSRVGRRPTSPVSGSGIAAALVLRRECIMLQQTFDQSAVNYAFNALGASGNLETGGGLTLLMRSLHSHLQFAELCCEGMTLAERQARALNRPPPLVVASAVRRAVVSACEALWPVEALLVSAQKLDCRAVQRTFTDNRHPAQYLVQALHQIPSVDVRSQMDTVRRILTILARLCEKAGAAALMAPVVHANGVDRCKEILLALQELDNSDIQRWRTHEQLTRFLDQLLQANVNSNPLAVSLQAKIREAVKEEKFQQLFLLRPEETSLEKTVDLLTCTGNLNNFQLVMELRTDQEAAFDP